MSNKFLDAASEKGSVSDLLVVTHRHFETIPYSEPRFMPPLRGSHLLFWGGSRGSAPYGAPPPGYFIPPLRGSEFRSLTLAKIPPSSPLQIPIYRAVWNKRKMLTVCRRFLNGYRRHILLEKSGLFVVDSARFNHFSFLIPWHACFLQNFRIRIRKIPG